MLTFWRRLGLERLCMTIWQTKWSVFDFLPFSISSLSFKMTKFLLVVCKIIVVILLKTFVEGFWKCEWNRRCFAVYRWCKHQFYILTTVALLERLRMTLWQTKMISAVLLAVFFQPFMFEKDNIFTNRMQDHCCYSSCDFCRRILEK